MKALWVLFLTISIPQISCQDKRILVKSIPKKVKTYGIVQIINPGKLYIKTLGTTKRVNGYTVFPSMGVEKNASVPDSLYFANLHNSEHRPRVKKVLPDFFWTSLKSRSKRSADVKTRIKPDKDEIKDIEEKDKRLKKDVKSRKGRRSKKLRSKSKRHKQGKLGNRTRNADRDTNNMKYTIKSRKRKGKRSRSRLKKGGDSNHKGKLRGRKSRKVSKNKLPKDSARRLIAGMDTIIEDYPYVVSIQKSGEHWCAGALLNPRLIITTANCLWKSKHISRMQIRAGSRYVHKGGQTAGIQEVMKHPGWGIRRNPDFDVALALLDKNIRFSDSVHGVDLPNRVMMPPFDDAWVTSWGADRRDGVYEDRRNTLQVYHTRLLDRNKCNNVTQRFGVTVSENFICLTQIGRRAPCTRDTGAPAVSDGVLWGMASWGIRKLCGTERFPAMFSYLASQANMDFILNATRFLMADKRFYPFLDRRPHIPGATTTAAPAISPF